MTMKLLKSNLNLDESNQTRINLKKGPTKGCNAHAIDQMAILVFELTDLSSNPI
jgi:hypothetical protein